MHGLIIVIDQGTTGTNAAVFEAESLRMLGNSKVEFPQIYPQPGWVEHNPEEIWVSAVDALRAAWQQAQAEVPDVRADDIRAVGITNQRETVVAWNRRTAELAGNGIVWQDRRTAARCEELRADSRLSSRITRTTGLVLDPYFSATKMEWMLKNYPKARSWAAAGELCLGTIDSYLIYRLTGEKRFVTDHTNASRTLLYSLAGGDYDRELLELFGVPRTALPEILPSAGMFGTCHAVPGLPDGVPIMGCIGDQQSALLGQNCVKPGEAKITFGTGAFILLNCGERPIVPGNGLLGTVAYSQAGQRTFALEGSAFIAGAAVQFLRDNFGWIQNAADSEALALSAPRDPGLFFVPALAGLGAPYWNAQARGALLGLSRGSSKGQIVRAVLESVALQNVQLLELMRKSLGDRLQRVGVDGGAAQNNMLMQFQADVLQVKLVRPRNVQSTSVGAARAALAGLGQEFNIQGADGADEFVPGMSAQEASTYNSSWQQAVAALDQFYRL